MLILMALIVPAAQVLLGHTLSPILVFPMYLVS